MNVLANSLPLLDICSTSLLKDPVLRDPSHWRFDLAKSGGGVLMDGATHWIRPLKLWSVNQRGSKQLHLLPLMCTEG